MSSSITAKQIHFVFQNRDVTMQGINHTAWGIAQTATEFQQTSDKGHCNLGSTMSAFLHLKMPQKNPACRKNACFLKKHAANPPHLGSTGRACGRICSSHWMTPPFQEGWATHTFRIPDRWLFSQSHKIWSALPRTAAFDPPPPALWKGNTYHWKHTDSTFRSKKECEQHVVFEQLQVPSFPSW